MKNNPCAKDCPDRTATCHAECGKYAEFAARCEKERKRRQMEGSLKSMGPGLKRALQIRAARFRNRGKTK